MIKLTQLITKQHRATGAVITQEPVLINFDKVVGVEPFEYQREYAKDESLTFGSSILFDESANHHGPLHVLETLNEIHRILNWK